MCPAPRSSSVLSKHTDAPGAACRARNRNDEQRRFPQSTEVLGFAVQAMVTKSTLRTLGVPPTVCATQTL